MHLSVVKTVKLDVIGHLIIKVYSSLSALLFEIGEVREQFIVRKAQSTPKWQDKHTTDNSLQETVLIHTLFFIKRTTAQQTVDLLIHN